MKQIVDEIPRTVNDAYEAMLGRSPHPKKARRLLHIVLAAVRPLTLREMNMALNIEEGQRSREEVDLDPEETFGSYLKNLCGLFISVYGSCIYLLHQTAKDFLMLSESSGAYDTRHNLSTSAWKHSMELDISNFMLAKICLTYLSFVVFEDDPFVFRNMDLKRHEIRDYCLKHDFLDYASKYWASHFRQAKENSVMLEMWHHVCDVSSKRFSTWVDCWIDHDIYWGMNPLCLASYLGHEAIVEQLIRSNVNLEGCNGPYDPTPLSYAAAEGYDRIAEILIRNGACINARCRGGRTPLMWAVFGSEAVLRVLLSVKADVNLSDWMGQTPLYAAVEAQDEAVVKLLLEAGASVHIPDEKGTLYLTFAADEGNTVIVRLLLEAGASINALNRDSKTALHIACANGDEPMVRILLEAGADPNIKTRNRARAIDIARGNWDRTIVGLLEPITKDPHRVWRSRYRFPSEYDPFEDEETLSTTEESQYSDEETSQPSDDETEGMDTLQRAPTTSPQPAGQAPGRT